MSRVREIAREEIKHTSVGQSNPVVEEVCLLVAEWTAERYGQECADAARQEERERLQVYVCNRCGVELELLGDTEMFMHPEPRCCEDWGYGNRAEFERRKGEGRDR